MLERIEGLPAGIVGLRAVGKLTKEDYEQIAVPMFEDARKAGRRMRVLYQIGPEFEGFTPGAVWEDAKLGLRPLQLLDGCALVTDIGWIRQLSRLAGFFLPCPVRVFDNQELDEAVDWLQSLPEGPGVSHRLVPASGVIVVEIDEPLRAQDFDALSQTADAWLETHHELRGIVLHARKFPGWENLEGLIRHVRFVRDYHEKIARIALVSDSALADIAPRLADHFVEAEIKSFDYDELDSAIAWAASPTTPGAHVPKTRGPEARASS